MHEKTHIKKGIARTHHTESSKVNVGLNKKQLRYSVAPLRETSDRDGPKEMLETMQVK